VSFRIFKLFLLYFPIF